MTQIDKEINIKRKNSRFMIIRYQNYVEKCMKNKLQKRGGGG